jgi:hypothetical protein
MEIPQIVKRIIPKIAKIFCFISKGKKRKKIVTWFVAMQRVFSSPLCFLKKPLEIIRRLYYKKVFYYQSCPTKGLYRSFLDVQMFRYLRIAN